ncbi:MAG: hypothetical protein MZV65_14205 [Chromatiales bacterium]|nr:hypothetical protein [Chromatiales bacterium]
MIVSIATREAVRSAYMIPAASLIPGLAGAGRAQPPAESLPWPGSVPRAGRPLFHGPGPRRPGRSSGGRGSSRFVAVVGASGSGKSSLLFAGVVPQLRQQEGWLIADFRPRGDPFRELATALTLLLYPGLDELERLKKCKQLADELKRAQSEPGGCR